MTLVATNSNGADTISKTNYISTISLGWNWADVHSGSPNDLLDVFFPSSSVGYISGTNGELLKTIDSGKSWQPLNSGTSEGIQSIYFLDNNIGYGVGTNGKIIKTTNGGLSWTTQVSPVSNSEWLYSVIFPSNDTGYICGGDIYGGGQIILKTTNGGLNWNTLLSYSFEDALYDLFAFDVNTAFAVGANGRIFKTINGGANWIPQNSTTSDDLYSIYFVNNNVGYAVGGQPHNNTQRILKTTDGGGTWVDKTSSVNLLLNDCYFSNEDVGFVTGIEGVMLKTTNGGDNWTPVNSYASEWLYAVDFNTDSTGFAVGTSGKIIRTGYDVVSSIADDIFIPEEFSLSAYPNPFSHSLMLSFDIINKSWISAEMFDAFGKKVNSISKNLYSQGSYELLLTEKELASGIYFLKFYLNDNIYCLKIFHLK